MLSKRRGLLFNALFAPGARRMKNVIKNIFPSMNNIIDVFKNKRSVPRGLLERYSFDTVALNSPDESLKKMKLS